MFEGFNVGIYSDGRVIYLLSMMVGCFDEIVVSVLFLDNLVVCEFVIVYLRVIRLVCMCIVNGGMVECVGNVVVFFLGW